MWICVEVNGPLLRADTCLHEGGAAGSSDRGAGIPHFVLQAWDLTFQRDLFMRRTFILVLILCLSAAWMVGCGDSGTKTVITPPPTVTSNFVFVRAGAPIANAMGRQHFDLMGKRGMHSFAARAHGRGGMRPMMDVNPGSDSVVMMKNDGTGETVLADQAGWFYAVQLSLDGKKGVGTVEDLDGYQQIFYVDTTNLNNLNPLQLTTDPEDHYTPQLSPDGSTVIFVKDVEGLPQAFTVKVTGGAETQIVVSAGVAVNFPSYTPDGTKIVFEEEEYDTIDIMNADGSGVTILTNQDQAYYDEFPSVSADGRTITFSSYPADESSGEDIYVVNIDGSNVRQLTTDGASWDPLMVNNKIVFISYRDEAAGGRIYAMAPDGTSQTNLTPNDTTDDFFIW